VNGSATDRAGHPLTGAPTGREAGGRAAAGRVTRVAVLGAGPLGGAVLRLLESGAVRGCTAAAALRSADAPAARSRHRLAGADVLVEAAGTAAAADWLPVALDLGLDVVLSSCAALADPSFATALAARRHPGQVVVPAGAIGGLDLLAAVARAGTDDMDVRLTTTKRPSALGRTTVFEGSAREAALAFPRTANVAVTLALATVGLDRVRVRVEADPTVARTRHRIEVSSPLGDYDLVVQNELAPGSDGRTSAVTAWSVVTCLEALAAGAPPGITVRR
jgi:aspartate dehydrogenase